MSSKISGLTVLGWKRIYRAFDENERSMADQVVREWVTSGDAGKEFDALSLVHEFRIRAALPELRALEAACRIRVEVRRRPCDDPAAPDDLEQVREVIRCLEEPKPLESG